MIKHNLLCVSLSTRNAVKKHNNPHMKGGVRLSAIGLFLGAVCLALCQSVTTPPEPMTFPDWREVTAPEDSQEFDIEFPSAIISPYPVNNIVPVRILLPQERTDPIPAVLI